MKTLSTLLLLFMLFIGCGYNPDKPVYDTAVNPDGFPRAALELLERLQGDSLIPADTVIDCFANLYLADQSLLDNQKWKDVVRKLGTKFRYQADEMADRGIEGYSQAAGYYELASCARPDDPKTKESWRLFSCWDDSVADAVASLMAASGDFPTTLMSVTDRLSFVKRFMFEDTLHHKFAREYLVDQLLGDILNAEAMPPLLIDSLTTADVAFLGYAGLVSREWGAPVAGFDDPRIDLVSLEISRVDSARCLAEIYFVPRQNPDADYVVALCVGSTDSAVAGGVSGSRYLPFDFAPALPASSWKVDKVAAACRYFDYDDDIAAVSIGLYRPRGDEVTYLPVAGLQSSMVEIPVSVGPGD